MTDGILAIATGNGAGDPANKLGRGTWLFETLASDGVRSCRRKWKSGVQVATMKRLLSASNLACYIRAAASVCLLLALILGTARIAGAQPLTINVGPDLGTYGIGQVQIPLTASGGSGAYTWSIFADVPPGLVLRSDVPSWFPPDTSEGLIGIATTPGSYTFTL